MLCTTFVPGAIDSVHGGPTIPFRFGFVATRVKPPQVVGVSVALGAGGKVALQPVVPGVWVPDAARFRIPQPKPAPFPSQLKNWPAAPPVGSP
jgi:hypothetical protein